MEKTADLLIRLEQVRDDLRHFLDGRKLSKEGRKKLESIISEAEAIITDIKSKKGNVRECVRKMYELLKQAAKWLWGGL